MLNKYPWPSQKGRASPVPEPLDKTRRRNHRKQTDQESSLRALQPVNPRGRAHRESQEHCFPQIEKCREQWHQDCGPLEVSLSNPGLCLVPSPDSLPKLPLPAVTTPFWNNPALELWQEESAQLLRPWGESRALSHNEVKYFWGLGQNKCVSSPWRIWKWGFGHWTGLGDTTMDTDTIRNPVFAPSWLLCPPTPPAPSV